MMLTASFGLLLAAMLQASSLVNATAVASDPCVAIAGKPYVIPSQALACLTSFTYNETVKTNAIDFFNFNFSYKHSPPPSQESTVEIRGGSPRLRATKYQSDYASDHDLFDVSLSLNDARTNHLFEDGKYNTYVAPDAVEFVSLLGDQLTSLCGDLGFDRKRLAGAGVVEVEGKEANDYDDHLATAQAGNFLDHGIRVSSVFTGYRTVGSNWSQRVGPFCCRQFPDQDYLIMRIIPVGSKKAEKVKFSFYATYYGVPFTDNTSFWEVNCAARKETNDVNYLEGSSTSRVAKRPKLQPIAEIKDASTPASAVDLPHKYVPTISPVAGSADLCQHFAPGADNFYQLQFDVEPAVDEFTSKGVTKLITNPHNNCGMSSDTLWFPQP